MQKPNLFYTQEGTAYVLRTVNKNAEGVVIPSDSYIEPYLFVNYDQTVSSPYEDYYLRIKTNKKIIPIAYSLSALKNGVGFSIDVTRCYSRVLSGPAGIGGINPSYKNYLSKIQPHVFLDYFTDNNHYKYSCQYNQLVFSDKDFMDTSDALMIYMTGNLAEAYTYIFTNLTCPYIEAGTYDFTTTFIYFEML